MLLIWIEATTAPEIQWYVLILKKPFNVFLQILLLGCAS